MFLFVAFLDMFGDDFIASTRYSFSGFVNLETVFFPLAAVLLATGVRPVHPQARLITIIAGIEYVVAAVFGVIFGVLFGVSGLAGLDAGTAFTALLYRVAYLGLLGVAGYAVLRLWQGLYYVPRPQPQPGVYGQPYGQPYGAYPPPGYGQYPGQPTPPPPGWGQPTPPPPPGWGQPTPPPPGWGQPPVSGAPTPPPPVTPFAEPTQAVPPTPVPFAEPTQAVPPSPVPFAEPTQAVPPTPADHTEVLPDDRPGFGPADQDPPRQ
ncbi:hypothetical protein Aca07nite_30580 [Actinoplanes capillaceus]|uniref:Uncharacterized protein n=1 Tax=Actinoplanes campanulatus TaxID=113559 RepID=A0ABQ3WHR6_9ACTN|nr:hypothetical protein [Actinoplanes capillaceus]GID45783.1 hypothetical protein Aca07nite_30580 [Actinoplanes capillaceus]